MQMQRGTLREGRPVQRLLQDCSLWRKVRKEMRTYNHRKRISSMLPVFLTFLVEGKSNQQ